MKLISFPYRWLPRTIFKNLNHAWWDIKNGLRNIPVFFNAVWWFRSWDWTGMAELIEVSAREMRRAAENGHHTGSDRNAQRLMVVERLAHRLLKDDYMEFIGYGTEKWNALSDYQRSQLFKHASYMEKQDAEYLGKMLRFIQHWWE